MNEQRFKIEYQLSENSVPVNTELKNKLMEMAEEYENKTDSAPEIKLSDATHRKRMFRIITEFSAIAACAAICAYTIPKINNQYFDRLNNNEIVTETQQPLTPVVTNPPAATSAPENASVAQQIPQTQPKAVNPSTPQAYTESAVAPKHQEQTEPDVTPKNQAQTESAVAPMNQEQNQTPEDSSLSQHETAQASAAGLVITEDTAETYAPAEVRASYKLIDSGEKHDLEELASRISDISNNLGTLDNWDDTLAPYKSADETIAVYYKSFSHSSKQYRTAAADFEKSYGDAEESGTVSEGIEKYDSELQGILFEQCRSDYRKAKNYIELTLLSDDSQSNADEYTGTEAAE